MELTPFERLWLGVVHSDNGCWEWTGPTAGKGYGSISLGRRGTQTYTHRLSWTIAHGPVPNDLMVLHRCDNPPCVRPSHLFLGTAQDNMRDMHAKGRWNPGDRRGENNGNSRFSRQDIMRIRKARTAGLTYSAIAKEHNVSIAHAHRIVTGKAWT